MIASAKSLRVERITSAAAKAYLDRHHPLGMGSACSFALGVIGEGRLVGVMTFGGPISNLAGKSLGLRQCELFELRKMHLLDVCPANSESRVLGVAGRIVKAKYPSIRALVTYCADEEKAVAYKAAGWVPMAANRYVREVRIAGKWYSVRNANRLGITAKAEDRKIEHRRKWALPLDAGLAAQLSIKIVGKVEKSHLAQDGDRPV